MTFDLVAVDLYNNTHVYTPIGDIIINLYATDARLFLINYRPLWRVHFKHRNIMYTRYFCTLKRRRRRQTDNNNPT